MTITEFFELMDSGTAVVAGSSAHEVMHRLAQEAIRLCIQLNNTYHTEAEITVLLSEMTGREVHESNRLFPPFNTECGKNIHLGKRVFINAGCKFQDQGGIYIGDDSLIGHNCVIATLNHAPGPGTSRRYDSCRSKNRQQSMGRGQCYDFTRRDDRRRSHNSRRSCREPRCRTPYYCRGCSGKTD